MKTIEEAKRLVAEAGKALLHERLVARTWGNVSCRVDETHFVITPSGLSYEMMSAEDTVPYDMTTKQWEGARKPSSEKGVHASAYLQFKDAGFVIHTHQMYASALGLTPNIVNQISAEDKEALGGVVVGTYGLPGTKRLKHNVAKALATGAHVILMAQHGALIVGRDYEEAFERSSRLERVCKALAKGQPDTSEVPSEGKPSFGEADIELRALAERVTLAHGKIYTSALPVAIRVSELGTGFRAQLDDMAQMIGDRLMVVSSDVEAITSALSKYDAVLVKGQGVMCKAQNEADGAALLLLAEKACVSYLHTFECQQPKQLSRLDTFLMRFVYLNQYSKKQGG